jgi:hypothetical protein
MAQPFDGEQIAQNGAGRQVPAQPQRAAVLTDAELNAVSYFAIGVASEGSVAGRDVSNRLSFAGNIGAEGRMTPVGNSGLSIGTLQTDLGQHPEVARSLVAAYQDWARANHPDWVLDARQQTQTTADLGRDGNTIVAQGGRPLDATVKLRLDEFLRSDDGIRYVHNNDVTQANKLMREVYTPLRETALYRDSSPEDQVQLAAMVGKAYNQSERWGGRILERIQNGTYDTLTDVKQGIQDLPDGRDQYMLSGRDAALAGAAVVNALRSSHEDNPMRQTWNNVLANPLVDPTRTDEDRARPNLAHEYDAVKTLFMQRNEAPAFVQALDRGATSMHGRTSRQGTGFTDDGLYATGNQFALWDADGNGRAYVNGQWREFDRDNLVRTRNADGTVDLSVQENGQRTPLLHVDPQVQAPRAEAAPAPAAPGEETRRADATPPGERAQPILAAAGPDLDRSGPMLQAPPKRQELEMSPGERQLFERAMHLVQNKAGLTEDDAKKVATDVVLTARHTPGLSEKPEYMDVRNGHVMLAERVGKEPIFNGYVNIEQSRSQTQEQVHEKVAVQNQQRDQQQSQQVQHDSASLPDRRNPLAKIDDEVSARVMSSMPALKI